MSKHASISKKLQKQFGKCVREYDMINPGDRVLVGLSGGKDSLALLHLIKNFQRIVPFEFEYKAVTIDYGDGLSLDHLQKHCDDYGIPFEIYRTEIAQTAESHIRENSSFCSFFSRMRRGSLYSACQQMGYNKLALGHHLDDAAESFFMNMFYNGTLRTLAPKYTSKYDIEIIRPLIKCREAQHAAFVEENGFATISDDACPAMKFPVKMPFAREKTKQWLKTMESEHDELFKMLKTAFGHLHAETFFDPRYAGNHPYKEE